MRKRDELMLKSSCLNKAKDDDLIFVLIQKDICMADTIRFWCQQRIVRGKNQPGDPQITEAQLLADKIDRIHIDQVSTGK